ncbi:MAG: response regulator [Pseudomonadales bacterium]|nr:response regulator [Pseudomonadales bacterium]
MAVETGREEYTIHLVDDDPEILDAFALYLSTQGFKTELYSSSQNFLQVESFGDKGCIVLDNHLPGISGLDVQQQLADRGVHLPIIFMSGDSEFKDVVSAVRGGAIGFLEKPFSMAALLEAIEEALTEHSENQDSTANSQEQKRRLHSLTAREREVYDLAIKGFTIKRIAEDLDISASTVEFHRSNILKKLEVNSIAELMAQQLGTL